MFFEKASRPIQRLVRGHLGRLRYEALYYGFHLKFPIIQKWFRGYIARTYVSLLRATLCVQRAWRRHEAMTHVRGLKLKFVLMNRIETIEHNAKEEQTKQIIHVYKKFMVRDILLVSKSVGCFFHAFCGRITHLLLFFSPRSRCVGKKNRKMHVLFFRIQVVQVPYE